LKVGDSLRQASRLLLFVVLKQISENSVLDPTFRSLIDREMGIILAVLGLIAMLPGAIQAIV
jgi:hypothetical protein